AQRPHAVGNADPAVELHGPRVGAVHLGVGRGRRIALDQCAAHAAPPEIDRQSLTDRARARDDDLGIAHAISPTEHMRGSRYEPQVSKVSGVGSMTRGARAPTSGNSSMPKLYSRVMPSGSRK